MSWMTKKRYGRADGAGSGSTGGVPGGAANDIQLNNGAGGFSGGQGSMTAARTILPVTSGQGGTGLRLNNGANDFLDEYVRVSAGYAGGGPLSFNILDVANVKNSSTFTMEVLLSGVQTSGTPGSTGFTIKLIASFRVTNAGVLAILAASVQDANFTFNDTGDAFSGTPSLTVNVGNSNVNLNVNLTTAKTFRLAAWCKITAAVN